MSRIHRESKRKITIAACEVEGTGRFGCIIVDSGENIVGFGEKERSGKGLINAGIYLMKRDILENFAPNVNFSFEKNFLEETSINGQPKAFISKGYFIDIGIPDDYYRANREFPIE